MNRSAYYHTNKSWSNHCLSFLNELLQHYHKYLSHISALLIWWKLWGRGLNILASIILFYFFEQNMNLYSITKLWCFGARSEPQAMAPTWTKTNKQKERPDVSERKYACPPTCLWAHPLTQHSGPSGIWPEDWDGQRGICHWEGPSLTTRHPLIGGRENQSASSPLSQSH